MSAAGTWRLCLGRIDRRLRFLGKTWKQLGEACGVPPETVLDWRERVVMPSTDNALDMAEFLGWKDTQRIAERARPPATAGVR